GPIDIDNQSVENIRASWYPYTMPFNLTGNPAMSLPCGFDAAGMPLAIQLIARPGEDERLLRVAALFEHAQPWAKNEPPRSMYPIETVHQLRDRAVSGD